MKTCQSVNFSAVVILSLLITGCLWVKLGGDSHCHCRPRTELSLKDARESDSGYTRARLVDHQLRASRHRQQLGIGNDSTALLVDEAMRIMSEKGLVLYTMLNDAYLEFVLSWLCNTRWMAGVHDHVLLATTDLDTALLLQRYWPAVSTVALNLSRYAGDQQYSQVGYVRMMVERTALVLRLLESDVRLLLFEVDCVWLRDPLSFLLDRTKQGADILATLVDDAKNRTAGGFLLLTPTDRTVALWRELTSQMAHLLLMIQGKSTGTAIHWKLNDQEFLSNLIDNSFGGIRVNYLHVKDFPDGNWYKLPEDARNSDPRPFIINNNFIAGNQNKKERARKWGHWFLSPEWRECSREAICDDGQLKSAIES